MSKKLFVCKGKDCKKAKSYDQLKEWGEELIKEGKIKKMKKTDCLGLCKKGYAIEFKGEVYSCFTKEELEKVIVRKKTK